MSDVIDLTFTIEDNMPTCGTEWHAHAYIEPMGKIETVGRNTHRIVLGSHMGTHMDAPYHFLNQGATIEQLPIEKMIGPIEIVDLTRMGQGCVVEVDDICKCRLGKRILLKYGWYKKWKSDLYYKDFPYLSIETAQFLIDKGVEFIAMDTPSPDPGMNIYSSQDSAVHKLFLKNDIIIVEYLNNTELLKPNISYELVVLPLKVCGCDGAPCRAIARQI